MNKKNKIEKPLKVSMNFDEMMQRISRVDPKELEKEEDE